MPNFLIDSGTNRIRLHLGDQTAGFESDPDYVSGDITGLIIPEWNGTIFVEGATQAEIDNDLDTYRTECDKRIKRCHEYALSRINGALGAHMALEYVVGLLESVGILNTPDTPHIDGDERRVIPNSVTKINELEGPGTTDETTEATNAKAMFDQAAVVYGNTRGIRFCANSDLDAATDRAGCDAAFATYTSEMETYAATLGVTNLIWPA